MSKTKSKPEPLAEILEQLETVRREFGPRARSRRKRLLDRAARCDLVDARRTIAYHEVLLFALAHPDDAALKRRVQSELRRVANAVRRLVADGGRRERSRLADSGLAHSTTTCTYTYDCMAWLATRFAAAVTLAWDEDDSLGADLDDFLPELVARVEGDGLLSSKLSTRAWFRLAGAGGAGGELRWLLALFARMDAAGAERDRIFESFAIDVRWRLSSPLASRTFQRFPTRPVAYQRGPIDRTVPPPTHIDTPLPSVRRLPVAEARRLIDVGRAALCVRRSETEPMTYADPREVRLARLEDGLDVAVFGMAAERRRPIESFFGYMAARNRVPVAYGGGWVFLDRCEIGIHVFDAFRGGASASLFAQVLRVYRALFGAKRFTVDPFQFGADNPDAIRSGAFWFYYRFEFRPLDPTLRRRAEAEWATLRADPTRHTAPALLRRFAGSRLVRVVDPADDAVAPDLGAIGHAVTAWIGRAHGGDRSRAERAAGSKVARALGVAERDRARWPETERRAFARMAVLAAMTTDLPRWTAAERRDLVALMRAKGRPRESVYAERLRRHARFRAALSEIAAAGGRVKEDPRGS